MHVIVYASKSLIEPDKLEEELAKIERSAQASNQQDQITGCLFYKDGNFLQILEGTQLALEDLMRTLEQDPRHENIEYIIDEPAIERTMKEWHLQVFNLNSKTKISFPDMTRATNMFRQTFFSKFGTIPKADILMEYYSALLK